MMKGLLAAAAAAGTAFSTMAANAAEYTIDPSHTFVQFRISHLGFSTMVGRFNKLEGEFSWDKAKPEDSAIHITIDTASVDTNWAERDKHLRGEEFLAVREYPQASFKSTRYTGDATGGKLEGELTLHGVTKPVTIDVEAVGEGADPWGGYRAGFDGTTTINRLDFGITKDLGPTAETMQFDLHIEGVQKK
ncbi:MAG: Protein YceI [Gammaproteobacteria bacterium]|nr:Protein YceI [Gammaproteobacteria bacterium]